MSAHQAANSPLSISRQARRPQVSLFRFLRPSTTTDWMDVDEERDTLTLAGLL